MKRRCRFCARHVDEGDDMLITFTDDRHATSRVHVVHYECGEKIRHYANSGDLPKAKRPKEAQ